MRKEPIKTIIATAIGGIILLFATVFLNAFLSSPPSRAEFDSFKVEFKQQNISISRRLQRLESGQIKIMDMIIKQKERSWKSKKN